MPIAILILFILFLYLAPRPFKWLLTANIIISALGHLALTILSATFSARKAGVNAGMFEHESIILLAAIFLTPVILIIGIISGVAARIFFSSK